MRYSLILALAAGASANAQSIVNPNRIRSLITQLESESREEPALHCDVSQIKPALNYGFRYQAGFTATVPLHQFEGGGHGWATLVRITPEGGARNPVYLISQTGLPPVPKTKAELAFGGGYLLGEGSYQVRWMMLDDSARVCRKNWRVEVKLTHADRNVKLTMPPDTVWEIGAHGARYLPRPGSDDAAPLRLTIFLHTAPLFPRRTRMRPNDMVTLMSTVSSLLERVPARSVRLVMFNLEQQKELFRKDGFLLREMAQVWQAMTNVELGLVDFQVLQNKKGHVDLLADMVKRELEEEQQSDVVLFLGPAPRFYDRVPQPSLDRTAGHMPQFYYFQLAPIFRQQQQPILGDSIKSAVSRVGGKTFVIHNPVDFAKAIERMEKVGRSTP